ncbi:MULTISPECIES: LLM class flavin-dependent oxidoreductase [Streptomyces]|jgi:alkanesulfonate monooxygenase SsuD/methylene tetrahydromethanopterin reductase-like flavin-dependent oxidoreductase (luciferase family)|uniref:LLM class flavin-dependent oxidoreductase n=1 Tax=Streptomyces thermoviolaceus subsp. thermoviolaceus TaxID=66860 RepID=A0ABX0YXJ6_STRTL|nr:MULTISPECIES: LLM class flavin-dependent oxidoreductase [Streptomyces]MCM3266408.1 LLM class flavin-dependent oxidoreductase [Streptomyces thermoviolaceus]NJP15796.1 LLM class flavin-dependent oxidoreductase [Streptomyces thermoviolaceus subsp. thermoviolaceus]RSS07625.1 LLM class flavin-dependent oxidoreductase [Streptomyces sp. WAC00469]WTD48503.1 LLM class flavin-dependent oxidoreductase [Streptomyces thermoviolaceus]GGV73034.1 luciferase [Streptomyces thermoviolaceus subsp. apingens]
MTLRLSTVILPYRRWHEGSRSAWMRAEELGFHTAYTYDHLSWRSFRDGPWFGAVPTLTAAAAVTERIRLGTLVTSPNFRHPVTLAKELISLDDISGGRITLGIGAGGTGFDATVLGQTPWTPRERADHFAEFVSLLDRLLTEDGPEGVTYEGTFYSAHEARNIPGCVQRPRLPFAVAATGPRGLRLAARHGQAWVTTGDPKLYETGTPEQSVQALRGQIEKLTEACAATGRDARELDKILLTGFTPDRGRPLESLDAFVDFAGRHQELGFTEIVVHWPIPDSDFAADQKIFEQIALEAPAQLA